MKKILVVVDMQNDFIDGPLGTPEARAIVDNVCAKIREGEWDLVYSTTDTHGPNYLKTQEGQKLPIGHCIMDTLGWQINHKVDHELDNADCLNFRKNAFGCTDILEYLDDFIIDTYTIESDIELTLVGVCTDICVVSNALLLKAHFPEMKIVVDASCCAGSTPEKHYMALDVMKSCQVDVVNNEWDELKVAVRKTMADTFGVPEEFWTDGTDLVIKNFVEE